MVKIGNSWDEILADEFTKDYYLKLREFLKKEYFKSGYTIYPDMNDIFNALKYTDYNDIKAVILGQDPYHGPNQAHGLCFSVKKGTPCLPSLVNIFRELHNDLGLPAPECGDLTPWAKRGVLMLNSVLTVRAGMAGSHRGAGWELFTDCVIKKLNEREKPIVFLLWGNYAKEKSRLITASQHHKLLAAHPSPLSAYNGFFGCRCFSKANALLDEPIDWSL